MHDNSEPKVDEIKRILRERLLAGHMPELPSSADIENAIDLFISKTALISLNSDNAVDRWIKERLRHVRLHSEVVPLSSMENWQVDETTGNISHVSGRFFSVLGVTVRHRTQPIELTWDQPIIDQPEIGILGILAKKLKGVLHFCLQAKEEPGNIHSVQLSPTVQATHSNYTRVHGGCPPPFVEYFLDPHPRLVLFAKLQTEDGGRFLFKSNRNMIVFVEQDLTQLPDNFIWLTLRQISELMKRDNLINACTRSILSAAI